MILWGPRLAPETTPAEVIGHYADADIERSSAVTSGGKRSAKLIEQARQEPVIWGAAPFCLWMRYTRFNKSQQDAFLPHIEDGTVTFIGATTENPSFELNSAPLSRARVYLLKSLSPEDIEAVLIQALNDSERGLGGQNIVLPDETRKLLARTGRR